MKRGEIRWYRFRRPDKKRPVLILSRDFVIEYLDEITIAPVTAVVRDIPSEVLLSRDDGMPADCAINFDYIQTVAKAKIGALITALPAAKMAEVSKAVSFALEL